MMSFKDFFLFLVLVAILFSEHFCEIIFKSRYWLESRGYLNVFSIFSSDSRGTTLAIVV